MPMWLRVLELLADSGFPAITRSTALTSRLLPPALAVRGRRGSAVLSAFAERC